MTTVDDILAAVNTLIKAKYNDGCTNDFYDGVYIGFFESKYWLSSIGNAPVTLPTPAKTAQDYVQAKAIAKDFIDKEFMHRREKSDFADDESYEIALEEIQYGPAAYNGIDAWREDIRKYLRDYTAEDVPHTGIVSSEDVTPEAIELAARMLYVRYTHDFEVDIDTELHLTTEE